MASPEDPEHVAQLHDTFPYKGEIKETERRGMTVKQLESVVDFVEKNCHQWTDTDTRSERHGQTISILWANLYHVNSWVIRPATKKDSCAFVELLAESAQCPTWFVSHWWGEAIQCFLKVIRAHFALRYVKMGCQNAIPSEIIGDAFYWVCAYANRQWNLDGELTADPKDTSFFKAMALAADSGGGIILVVDEYCTPFQRIWCCFEESVAALHMSDKKLLLDVGYALLEPVQKESYLSGHRGGKYEAIVLTEGSSPPGDAGNSIITRDREKHFPCEVLEKAMEVAIEKGAASFDKDRVHILNSLAQRPLDQEPTAEEHKEYDKINRVLRSMFAQKATRLAIERGTVIKMRILETVAEDMVSSSFTLDLSRCTLENVDGLCTRVAGSQALESFDLSLYASQNLCDLIELGRSIGKSTSLKKFSLNIGVTPSLHDISALGQGIGQCASLESFFIGAENAHITDLSSLAAGIRQNKTLKKLQLDLRSCGAAGKGKGKGKGEGKGEVTPDDLTWDVEQALSEHPSIDMYSITRPDWSGASKPVR